MDWRSSLLSETNITELQRLVNAYYTSSTELERRVPSLAEQQYLSKKKELSELYVDLLKQRSSENWELKRQNQHLEHLNKEITERCDAKDAEVKHYGESLAKLEIEYKARLAEEESKSKELEQKCQDDLHYYCSRLSQEESNSKKFQKGYVYWEESYRKLRTDFNRYVKGKEAEIKQMEDRMSRKDDELRKLNEELKDKTERLASIFQRRLKQDQRKVENTKEFNTPSDVEKDFKSFIDGPRIDACDTMEKSLPSTTDTQIRYLTCIIFVTAYEQVEEAREAVYDLFDNTIRQLIDKAPRKSQEFCTNEKENGCPPVILEVPVDRKEVNYTRDIVNDLMLSLKQTAHYCDLTCFEKDVKQVILGRWTKCLQEEQEMPFLPKLSEKEQKNVIDIKEVDEYIEACIRLSWKIVTQVPPLRLEYTSSKFNKRMHSLTRLHYDDERYGQGQTENIACYLWPALLEHGGRVIFPGEVLCEYANS